MAYCALTRASPAIMALRIHDWRSNPATAAKLKAARLDAAQAPSAGGR